MKKPISLIIATLLIWLQVLPAQAQTTPAEVECVEENPIEKKGDNPSTLESIAKEWEDLDLEEKTRDNYQIYFEQSQEAYHMYIECLFEYARAIILQRSRRRQGTFQAETPNLAFWMSPSSACLEFTKLQETINATKPNHLLSPALEAFGTYRDHLESMKIIYDGEGGEQNISESIDFINNAELESALVAMDLGFLSFKELRTAFVLHVQFQCLLNNLEKYRRSLAEIRRIVDSLPGRLQNASIVR